ncbi:protein ROS1A-like [Hevea brasiliensis]|uniref:protein ROS1A-like n=1 Tax=Hevea brasiliensis TaxID=3981 RepID=UPI0025EDB2FC|nr:protein ROS1A-like [Hevea brasiliensis]
MRAECKHLASAIASANLSLPDPSKKVEERYMVPKVPLGSSNLVGNSVVVNPISVSLLESNKTLESGVRTQNCEPIIEEPKSPLHEQQIEDIVSEDIIDDEEEIPTIQLNNETFKENLHYFMDKYGPNFQTSSSSRALVPVSVTVDSIPIRKLKQTSHLRTEHQVYEIPDNHELLRGLKKRECDDSLPYLLAIWTAGETPDSCEPPKKRCNSQGPELCNDQTCFSCQSILEDRANIVRGAILVSETVRCAHPY